MVHGLPGSSSNSPQYLVCPESLWLRMVANVSFDRRSWTRITISDILSQNMISARKGDAGDFYS